MSTKKEQLFYQYTFCIKMLLLQHAQLTLQLAQRPHSTISPITIRKIRAIRGVKHFNKKDEFSQQYGDILTMFKLANIFVYTKGKLYRNPSILCMEVQQGQILTESQIISEGKLFYEQTIMPLIETVKSSQQIKLFINQDIVCSEIISHC